MAKCVISITMIVCKREVSRRTVGIALAVLSVSIFAAVGTGLGLLLHKASVCPNSDWVKCEVSRSIIPTAVGYEYRVLCDNSTETQVPKITFIRNSLSKFTIISSMTPNQAVFNKSSVVQYFWPAWDFNLMGKSGKMSYNLLGITSKYSIKWPMDVPFITWSSEQYFSKSLPDSIRILKTDDSSEVFYFNSKISLIKSYRACIRKEVMKQTHAVPIALGVVVSYAIYN